MGCWGQTAPKVSARDYPTASAGNSSSGRRPRPHSKTGLAREGAHALLYRKSVCEMGTCAANDLNALLGVTPTHQIDGPEASRPASLCHRLRYFFRVPSPSKLQPTNYASAGAILASETEATRSVASSRTGAARVLSTRTYSAKATLVWVNDTSANAADFAR